MTDKEQIKQCADQLDDLVHRWCAEYDLTYAAAVGILSIKIHALCQQASELGEEQS